MQPESNRPGRFWVDLNLRLVLAAAEGDQKRVDGLSRLMFMLEQEFPAEIAAEKQRLDE